jgi:membrane protein DedA with SNARE-associated domain
MGDWSYVLLFILIFLEGPTATLAGAVAAGSGLLDPVIVFVIAAVANLTADSFWYGLGRWGREANILRWARKAGVKEETLAYYETNMHTHGLKILLAAKLTLSFAVPALIAAGLTHVPWRKAIVVLASGEALWSGGLVLAGFYLGHQLARLEQGLQIAGIVGGFLFIILLITLFKHHKGQSLADDASLS